MNSIENSTDIWKKHYPLPRSDAHKYDFGHALILGGGITCTGASRLASISALRSGAGLVTVLCETAVLPIYATALTSVMVKPFDSTDELVQKLEDTRIGSILIGPGYGLNQRTREHVGVIVNSGIACVLDADALTSFQSSPDLLLQQTHSNIVLTPHEGEFRALFPVSGNRSADAIAAAQKSRAVVVLKGADTIIASPEGNVVINKHAPAWLATAGSGDVLSGIITGLIARGMSPFDAACAGVWLHSAAARNLTLGMIAEDIPAVIPEILATVFAHPLQQ